MSLVLFLYSLVLFLLIGIQYTQEKRWFNLISILSLPYLIIVILNNIIASKLGFFPISDKALILYSSSVVCFYLGSLPLNLRASTKYTNDAVITCLSNYKIKTMTIVLSLIAILGLIKVILNLSSGINILSLSTNEGELASGITGHILNLSYSIAPIVFLYWTYSPRKILYLLPIILLLFVNFLSFVKYHTIGFAINLFIFTILYRPSLAKKAIILLCALITTVFVLNYAISFASQDVEVASTFYYNHLWKYCAGSLINGNYLFAENEVSQNVSIWYKILSCLSALPNLFIYGLFDTTIFPNIGFEMFPVNTSGEESNVINLFGYFFNPTGGITEILVYYAIIILFGGFSALLYKKQFYESKKKYHLSTFLSSYLTFFIFLSFFSPYGTLSGPWEICLLSLIIPPIFKKKRNFAV